MSFSATAAALPRTLGMIGRQTAIVMTAAALATATQVLTEETRGWISNLRGNGSQRRQRNSAMVLLMSETGLPLSVQDKLRRSRDVCASAMALLTDPNAPLSMEHHTELRACLARVTGIFLNKGMSPNLDP